MLIPASRKHFRPKDFPCADEITVEFLIGVLATRFQKYDVASRMVASILTSPSANARTKDKARELKDQILEELKSQKK